MRKFLVALVVFIATLWWSWRSGWEWLRGFLRIRHKTVLRGREMENDPYCEKLALDEMRREYDAIDRSADALDSKANHLIANSSLVFGLIATLQLSLLKPDGQPMYYWLGLIVAIGLYVVMILLATGVRSPRPYITPIRADWDEIARTLLQWESTDATNNMTMGYVNQIKHNLELNRTKAVRLQVAVWIFPFTVVLMILLSLVPAR